MHAIVRPTKTDGCTDAQKEAALDELVIMCDGLWPTEASGFIHEAAEEFERAETLADLRDAFSFWISLISEREKDPDDEARTVLIPEFARDADEHAASPVPWGRICWRPPLLPEELLDDERISLRRLPAAAFWPFRQGVVDRQHPWPPSSQTGSLRHAAALGVAGSIIKLCVARLPNLG